MLPVVLRSPLAQDARSVDGKVDSGADLCAVPDYVIAELDLPPVRRVRAAGFNGVLLEAILFHVDIELALGTTARRFEHIEALSTRRPYAIIGRNVLQRFVTRLDGPNSVLTVTAPRRRKGRAK